MNVIAVGALVFLVALCFFELWRYWSEKLTAAAIELDLVRARRDELESALLEVVASFNNGGVTFHNNAYEKLVTLSRARSTLNHEEKKFPKVKIKAVGEGNE